MDLVVGHRYKLKDVNFGHPKGSKFIYRGKYLGLSSIFDCVTRSRNPFAVSSIYTDYPEQYFEPDTLPVGTLLRSKQMYIIGVESGDKFQITGELPDEYILRTHGWGSSAPPALLDLRASKIDIWNWFEMWPGQDPPVVEKKECEHKFVNTSFMAVRMECKHCGIPEDTYLAQKNKLGRYEHDGS